MLVTLDFETYYDKEYSLKKLTTEEYIRDSRFHAHGVGVKIENRPAVYFRDRDVHRVLSALPWSDICLITHNAAFDAAILSWAYGYRPRFLLDTMSMARAVFPYESASLANLAVLLGIGAKGQELENFLGVERLNDAQQEIMGEYCRNDVELTYTLFARLAEGFPVSELRVIDQSLRMFTEPMLVLDVDVLEKHKNSLLARQEELLRHYDLESLRSNPRFAAVLTSLGVDPPMKTSLTTGKPTYAFAKTDEGLLVLREHDNPAVQAVVAARLGVKSSLEMTRTEMFLGVASRGTFPVPLNYWGARTTGRFCLTGETYITVLRNGCQNDILLPELRITDLVWDGEEFVAHGGLVCRGVREVISYDGITGTPDHRVFVEESEDGEAVELREAMRRGLALKVAPLPEEGAIDIGDAERGSAWGEKTFGFTVCLRGDGLCSSSGYVSDRTGQLPCVYGSKTDADIYADAGGESTSAEDDPESCSRRICIYVMEKRTL